LTTLLDETAPAALKQLAATVREVRMALEKYMMKYVQA